MQAVESLYSQDYGWHLYWLERYLWAWRLKSYWQIPGGDKSLCKKWRNGVGIIIPLYAKGVQSMWQRCPKLRICRWVSFIGSVNAFTCCCEALPLSRSLNWRVCLCCFWFDPCQVHNVSVRRLPPMCPLLLIFRHRLCRAGVGHFSAPWLTSVLRRRLIAGGCGWMLRIQCWISALGRGASSVPVLDGLIELVSRVCIGSRLAYWLTWCVLAAIGGTLGRRMICCQTKSGKGSNLDGRRALWSRIWLWCARLQMMSYLHSNGDGWSLRPGMQRLDIDEGSLASKLLTLQSWRPPLILPLSGLSLLPVASALCDLL